MDDIIEKLNNIIIDEKNIELINYVRSLNIDNNIKILIITMINNDNYTEYLDIYNICIENDIELPPI
jgi:predicted transcriptional regulator